MAYATLAEVKQQMGKTDAGADVYIPSIIDAATEGINNFCNRPDGFEASDQATQRFFPGNGKAFMHIDECVEITAVAVKDSATDTAYTAWTPPTTNMSGDGDWFAFTGDPQWPDFNSLPRTSIMVDPNGDQVQFTSGLFTGLRGFPPREGSLERQVPTVRVTARWGYAEDVPPAIKQACIMQTTIWFKRLEGAMATALATTELGTLELFATLDPAVEYLLRLGRYVRPLTGRR
jgi:hypothetical protein